MSDDKETVDKIKIDGENIILPNGIVLKPGICLVPWSDKWEIVECEKDSD